MNEQQYRITVKKWINHKLLLANSSHWYKAPIRAKALQQVRNAFNDFLRNDKLFTAQKIAQRLINNEDILNVLLPIPGNPSYENSARILAEIINYSKTII